MHEISSNICGDLLFIFVWFSSVMRPAATVFATLLLAFAAGGSAVDTTSTVQHRISLQAKGTHDGLEPREMRRGRGSSSRGGTKKEPEKINNGGGVVSETDTVTLLEHNGGRSECLFGTLTGDVTIGGQNFEVAISTGYSDVWVFGKELEGKIKNSEEFDHSFYDPSKSKTYKPFNSKSRVAPYKFMYYSGDIAVEGERFYDTVSLGSVEHTGARMVALNKFENKRSSKMADLGFADRIFNADDIDGIVGLGLSTLPGTTIKDHPILHKIGIFALYFAADGTFGQLHLGGWDKSYLFDFEEVQFAPIMTDKASSTKRKKKGRQELDDLLLGQHYWKLKAEVTLDKRHDHTVAVIDSGVGAIYAPKKVLTEFFNKIGMQKTNDPNTATEVDGREYHNAVQEEDGYDFDSYYMPCDRLKSLPYLRINFDGGDGEPPVSVSLSPHEYFGIPLLLPPTPAASQGKLVGTGWPPVPQVLHGV